MQTDKLASLGQLTAGIAHEIKNPLNFVNNFASVSAELIDELQGAKLEAKKASGAKLDNRHNLAEAGASGRRAHVDEADRFTATIRPIIAAAQAAGIVGRTRSRA